MYVGSIEAVNHLGGAGAGFDGLEDAEGDEGPAVCIVQAVRLDARVQRAPYFLSQIVHTMEPNSRSSLAQPTMPITATESLN